MLRPDQTEIKMCPCGCGDPVAPGRTWAHGACYQVAKASGGLRARYPRCLTGQEAKEAIRRHAASLTPVCPVCGCEKATWNGYAQDFLSSPEALPNLGFRCDECGLGLIAHPDGCVRLSPCGVYFVRCVDFIKIGVAMDFELRSSTYWTDNPYPIDMIGFLPSPHVAAQRRELELHGRWAHLRHRGEWFRAEPELVDWIQTNATTLLHLVVR